MIDGVCPILWTHSLSRIFSDRVHRAGLHVVLEAERVADFVRHHVFQQPAHQIVGQRQLLRARIERAHLHEVPVAGQVHHVVIELDVRVQNLAGARIGDVRPAGVFGGGGQPADHRMAHVFRAPGRGPPAAWAPPCAMIAFLKPAASKAGFQSSTPFFSHGTHLRGRRGIDVVDDRLHRLGDRRVRVLLLQPPAGDVAYALGLVLVARCSPSCWW